MNSNGFVNQYHTYVLKIEVIYIKSIIVSFWVFSIKKTLAILDGSPASPMYPFSSYSHLYIRANRDVCVLSSFIGDTFAQFWELVEEANSD